MSEYEVIVQGRPLTEWDEGELHRMWDTAVVAGLIAVTKEQQSHVVDMFDALEAEFKRRRAHPLKGIGPC